MISLPFLIVSLGAIVFFLTKIVSKRFDYFEKRGLKFQKPYPFIGTNTWLPLKRIFADFQQECYNKFSKEKVFGLFDFQTPVLVVKDPALIKRFLIKDFDYFCDRNSPFSSKTNQLLTSTLPLLKGQKWREMRASLSPAFTGSKMRLMFDLMSNCGEQLVENIKEDCRKSGPHSHDIKGLFTRFTNDVIATCVLGIKCDSFQEPDNEFYRVGRKFLNLRTAAMAFKMLLLRFFPMVSAYFKIEFVDEETKQFFRRVIIDTMAMREEKKIVRPDMINLLMQMRKGELRGDGDEIEETATKKNWTDIEIIAQCFIFFLAGFETVSTLLVFICYELAINLDVQAKLRAEVIEVRTKLDGKSITYEAIQDMNYLEMVISETLRKWPPAVHTDRVCAKTYKYQDEDGHNIEMNKGDMIWVPIFSLHRDPQYFPDPEKFDPERFGEDKKLKNNFCGYLPFGMGPRVCIGSRFALLETKAVLYYLLSEFSLEVCDETTVPLKLRKGVIAVAPEKNVILNLKPLKKK